METKLVMKREQEQQLSQMSHIMQLSSQIKKRTFTSSDEDNSYSDIQPIIPANLMSVKEILDMKNLPHHRTWEVLQETMAADEEYHREKWTWFGNEVESVEVDVIKNQHELRSRVDKTSLRRQAENKKTAHMNYLEKLSQKAPDFTVPLRAHTVWEGMRVMFSCRVQGCPPPKVEWYKDGKPLIMSSQPWNYSLKENVGLSLLEIRRCSPEDAGEYKVVARSAMGEAVTFGTLVVNSYQGAVAGSELSQITGMQQQQEAEFEISFPPTWVTEGSSLSLQCTFTSALLPFQQDVSWFRDGIQLQQSKNVDIRTFDNKSIVTILAAHKENEGVYSVRLMTSDGFKEHMAFVYVKDGSAAVLGGPASPLAVKVSDVNKDYVFLTWQPPSADGLLPVEGYYVERKTGPKGTLVSRRDMQRIPG